MNNTLIKQKKDEQEALLETITSCLDFNKAEDIKTIPLLGKTDIADYFVIAGGTSSRHTASLADNLEIKLKEIGIRPQVEGRETASWILLDCGDIIVHIFKPETRDFYNIEKIWEISSAHRTAIKSIK